MGRYLFTVEIWADDDEEAYKMLSEGEFESAELEEIF